VAEEVVETRVLRRQDKSNSRDSADARGVVQHAAAPVRGAESCRTTNVTRGRANLLTTISTRRTQVRIQTMYKLHRKSAVIKTNFR